MSDASDSAGAAGGAGADPGASAERARPQYGEYATPEEQRARIQASDPTGSLERRPDPAFSPPAPASRPGFGPGLGAGAGASASPLAPKRLADRIATFALLGYGLVNVLLTVPGLFDFQTVADMYFQIAGIPGSFTNIAAGQTWGAIAAVVLIAGYVATLWLSWRQVRRGRVAWWIPLVGGVVTNLVVGVLVIVPLFGDPAMAAYLTGV